MAILVVDDEPDIRESLAELFEDAGYAVSTAADGAEALEILAADELPCVVILDLACPASRATRSTNRWSRTRGGCSTWSASTAGEFGGGAGRPTRFHTRGNASKN